jgi:spoIIIJ-associated protein
MADELIISARSAEEAIEEAVHSWEISADELVAKIIDEEDQSEDVEIKRYRVFRNVEPKTFDPTAARELMKGLLTSMALEADFEDRTEEGYMHITIKSEDAGLLIGKYGRTLEALQLMMNLMTQKKDPNCGLRIVLDAAGYREKREEQLHELSRKAVERVQSSHREYEFKPMSPIDRRIVHRFLLETEGITTFSRGLGENRYVVIAEAGPDGEPLPSRGGGRSFRGGRDRGDRGEHGGRDRGGPRRRDDRGGRGRPAGDRPPRDRDRPPRDRDRGPRRPDDRPREHSHDRPRDRPARTYSDAPIPESQPLIEGESLSGRLATGEASPEEVYGGGFGGGRDRDRDRGDRDRDRDRGRDRGGDRDRGRGPRTGSGSTSTRDRDRGGRGGRGGPGGQRDPRGPRGGGGSRDRDRDKRGSSDKSRPSYSLPEDEPLWASEGPDPEFG